MKVIKEYKGYYSEDLAWDSIIHFNKCCTNCLIEDHDYEIKVIKTDVGLLYYPEIYDLTKKDLYWQFCNNNSFVQGMMVVGSVKCR